MVKQFYNENYLRIFKFKIKAHFDHFYYISIPFRLNFALNLLNPFLTSSFVPSEDKLAISSATTVIPIVTNMQF